MQASFSISLPMSQPDNATSTLRIIHGGRLAAFIARLNSTVLDDRAMPRLSGNGREALFRLNRFKELKANWDSYGAVPPSEAIVDAAIRFVTNMDRKGISPYFVSPGPNGEILVQYRSENGHEAELYIEEDGTRSMLLITPGKPPYEASLDMEFLLAHLRPSQR